MNKKSNNTETKDFEWILRRHFGLKGPYYTKKWKRAMACDDERKADELIDQCIFNDKIFTEATKSAWSRALSLVDDLVEVGIITKETATNISDKFCDYS